MLYQIGPWKESQKEPGLVRSLPPVMGFIGKSAVPNTDSLSLCSDFLWRPFDYNCGRVDAGFLCPLKPPLALRMQWSISRAKVDWQIWQWPLDLIHTSLFTAVDRAELRVFAGFNLSKELGLFFDAMFIGRRSGFFYGFFFEARIPFFEAQDYKACPRVLPY